jgi:hypothetical protein
MPQNRRAPSLSLIFSDLLLGLAPAVLLDQYFPGAAGDWIPWDEQPATEFLTSIEESSGHVDEVSEIFSTPPPNRPDIPTSEFLRPIDGLEELFGFKSQGLARMAGVSDQQLRDWRISDVPTDGDGRMKLVLLSTLFVQLAKRFDGKPYREFYAWLAEPLHVFGWRSPLRALHEGYLLQVVNYLALADLQRGPGSEESERSIHTARANMSPIVRTWMPSKSFFFVFTIVHAGTSVALFFRDLSLVMARFDSGLPPSSVEQIISSASTALLWPVFTAATRSSRIVVLFPGILGWVPLVANSALWAVASWWCVVALSRLRRNWGDGRSGRV